MKRLLAILLSIPSICLAQYTEFYCQNGGSNVNAGSTTNNTAAYTSTNGNWSTATNIFTPTDGSTPASTVSVGDFVSIYLDGATTGVFIARVTAVAAGINGGITVSSTAKAGIAPSTLATGRSLKAGGAWQGPNAAIAFPFSLATMGSAVNTSSHQVRVNFKNDQTYSITAAISPSSTAGNTTYQGYTSTVGDLGKATLTSTVAVLNWGSTNAPKMVDLIFVTTAVAGTTNMCQSSSTPGALWLRCVFKASRGSGLVAGSGTQIIESEFYDCNKSNTATSGSIEFSSSSGIGSVSYCVIHDATGGSNNGIYISASAAVYICNTIFDTLGLNGIKIDTGATAAYVIQGCDFYNNGGDGINVVVPVNLTITNCNFIKNTGWGIRTTQSQAGGQISNCGYGSGTQANGSGDTSIAGGFGTEVGKVTYASNLTPWVDPANGDFRINLAAANFAGRGVFTETQLYTSPNTVGFPDIGAAQSKTGVGGTFSKEVSYGFPQ
jgi:hypothetical protein